MARTKAVRSEVAEHQSYIEGVVKNLHDRLYGPTGLPWGTTLEELEELVVQLGQDFSRRLLRAILQKQADQPTPSEREHCPQCQSSDKLDDPDDPEPRIVTTRVGDAEWSEPKQYCRRCRRNFFPSVGEFGD